MIHITILCHITSYTLKNFLIVKHIINTYVQVLIANFTQYTLIACVGIGRITPNGVFEIIFHEIYIVRFFQRSCSDNLQYSMEFYIILIQCDVLPFAVRDITWMSALPVHSMKCQKALMQVTLTHLHIINGKNIPNLGF